jgi:hypothetical protein
LMASERADGVGVGETKQSDWTEDTEDGNDGTMEIMGDEQLNSFAGALHPNNSRESIRSSDTHPNFNGDHLRASELTPPPHGEIQTVNGVSNPPRGVRTDRVGIKQVRWQDPIALTLNWHSTLEGLQSPILEPSGHLVTGANTNSLRIQNKWRRHKLQEIQPPTLWWTKHTGDAVLPPHRMRDTSYRNKMCPAGLATSHPAGDLLAEWSKLGCPTRTGKPWTKDEMWEAVEKGPHQSSLSPDALAHFAEESVAKVAAGQAKLVLWNEIKDDPPPQLKISPIAAIPHKPKAFRLILDLSFRLRFKSGGFFESVNNSTVKLAPKGALNQLGHFLSRIIHVFAEAPEDAYVFMAKWDIKDGFWRMDCKAGEEYNFAYVLPQEAGKPITLVIPTSSQMGWVESPPYFCAATETARDIASTYCNTMVGSLDSHKFIHNVSGDPDFNALLVTTLGSNANELYYALEVYIDNFMSIVIPTSQEQLLHVATAVMTGIHDVFPANAVNANNPISEKKPLKGEGQYSLSKTVLGFNFDGRNKTLWLEEEKRAKLLTILHSWVWSEKLNRGIPFKEIESVVARLRHAFIALPGGKGLLSPCNRLLKLRPQVVYLHRNEPLHSAISNCRIYQSNNALLRTGCRVARLHWGH